MMSVTKIDAYLALASFQREALQRYPGMRGVGVMEHAGKWVVSLDIGANPELGGETTRDIAGVQCVRVIGGIPLPT